MSSALDVEAGGGLADALLAFVCSSATCKASREVYVGSLSKSACFQLGKCVCDDPSSC